MNLGWKKMREKILKEEIKALTLEQIKTRIIEIFETYEIIEKITIDPVWLEVKYLDKTDINPSRRR